MENILVTGGAGFIGSNFIRYLLNIQPDVHIYDLDLLTYAGSPANLKDLPDPSRHTFIRGDICDRPLVDQILHEHAINKIIHFAAETHVDRSILGPAQFIQTNVIGTFTLLEAARQAWLNDKIFPLDAVHFHHVSTDEVYGTLKPQDPAFTETTQYAPNSPYSASKAASDHLVRAYFHTYGLPVTLTNCSNNYGPFQFPEKLIPLMILNSLEGRPLPVYGDGQQIRDWLYVEDHCEAIWLVATRGKLGETYNVGGNNQPSNLEIIHDICNLLDAERPTSGYKPHQQLIQYVTDRPGHDRRYAMNIQKIQADLGWQPRQSLETGLEQTVKWYLDHPDWVAAIRNQGEYEDWMDQNYSKRGETL
jgi:dTDP-glucose 4,6-dehydratase